MDAQVDDEQLAKILKYADENVKHFKRNENNLPSHFGKLVEWHIEKKGVSYDWVVEFCDLTAVTLRKLRNNDIDNIKPITIIKFAIGMRLSYPYARHLLTQAGINVERVSSQNAILLTVLTSFPRVGLAKTYKILKVNNQEKYLHLTEKFINSKILKKI